MTKKIRSYSPFIAVLFVITNFDAFFALVSFIKTVLFKFFFLQFNRKFGFTKIPIAKVDNPLDKKIPFVPEKIVTYIDFTSFWIRPLSMLIKKLGAKDAKPYVVEFLKKISLTYKKASQVYKMCMTTTDRPKHYNSYYFRLIHFLDPHYLCVPSLHISVIILVCNFYKNIFPKIDKISNTEKDEYLKELYSDAIKIAESVLYIKQHSVNCIPAALYMMTFILFPNFNAVDAIQFLKDLFVKSNISETDQKEIKDYMYFIFERFLLVSTTGDNWILPIRSWIKQYCIETNQEHIAKKIK